MNLTDNLKLLQDYADHGDEAAFRELVERYVDMVYSAAFRRVGGDTGLAQDVTQAVFTDLAHKASSLRKVELLGGWLHRHTGFVASNMVRSEQRRQIREQEAATMNATQDSAESIWQQMAPMLDDTIEHLEPEDRQAILLRFFERHDFRHIGSALGISDDAAQKRVSRALDKLRTLLTNRGVTLSAVLLGTLLAGKVVAAAPSGLAVTISNAALAGAAVGGGIGLTLMKSLLFKVAVGGAAVAVALWMVFQHVSQSTSEKKLPPASTTVPAQAENSAAPTSDASPVALQSAKADSLSTTNNILLLNIMAADSGQPVPNVELDYWLWANGDVKHKKPLVADRFGVGKVPVPDGTTELILVSQRDGFADTLLEWHPDRGETIPAQYTLKLARAVPIGGTVVDPDGNPVAGAEVAFGNRTEAGSETRPQSDDFGWPFWIHTTTDDQGHWQINRIGKEALQTITGAASHPDFVRNEFLSIDKNTDMKKQFMDGTYVFKLGNAVIVSGTVKDSNGQPVPAHVLVGMKSEVNARETNCESDGSFSVRGCQPGKNMITAEAKDYAAKTLQVELTNGCGPFQLTLQHGKIVKLRVVGADGNPVAKAQVYFDNFPRGFPGEGKAPTQVEFNGKTDANGRLEWDSAPDEKLTFDVTADGYLRKDSVEVPANGMEHVITLQPGLTISGTVSDATTGQPIPRFRIITGWPNIDPFEHTTNFSWSTIDRFWLNFTGGKFQYTYDEEVLGGVNDPTYVFKFEADGYAPFITRCVPAAESSARFDVALTPAQTIEITVLAPDGGPAANADVGLGSPGSRLYLVPGGLSQNIQSGGTLLHTDSQGQFALTPDPTIVTVVAANAEGYAQASLTELATNPVITLLPWGRLEGTYLVNGQPVADQNLSFGYGNKMEPIITTDFTAFKAKTDDQGRFTFPQVPAGNCQISVVSAFGSGMHSGWSAFPVQWVTNTPGETTTVVIDRTNRVEQAKNWPPRIN